MAIPQTASGTTNDKQSKSFVQSPTRGENYTAREVFVGNDDSSPIHVSDSRGPGRQCFAEVLVSGLSGQLITSYTVPLMKKSSLLLVSVSGENKAEYTIKINGVTIGVVRTYYTYYNENFACNDLELLQNDTVTVTVENKSNTPAIFNATIFYKEFE